MANNYSAETESEIVQKIESTFKMFENPSDNTVDVREISTIVYSLGCCPTQADLHVLIAEVEEIQSGSVKLDKFLPAMTKILLQNKFPPVPKDRLLQAFEVLDKEKKGHLEPEELTKHMTQEGEAFTDEEMKEMLTALADCKQKRVFYKEVINQLIVDPDASTPPRKYHK